MQKVLITTKQHVCGHPHRPNLLVAFLCQERLLKMQQVWNGDATSNKDTCTTQLYLMLECELEFVEEQA